ncbi:cellulose binding domain-containing protein [Sorangium sp. So ce887]|uniref:cellulose binding domain-containing protein n=1 Tax=Sorangium sp. So ce887 TaxID=3133324 RepID=UPI003F621C9C
MSSGLVSPDGTMTAEITVPSDWGNGYCASVTIRNTGSSETTAWGLVIGLNGSTLNHAWNARITESNGQMNAVNEGYNGTLAVGASTMWGFCASGTGRPTIVSVDGSGGSDASTSTSASSSAGSGGATGTGGSGGEGGGSTTVGTGGEGGGTTTGAGGEGGGTTTAGTGGEGGGTTTAGTGGEGGGTTTAGTGGEGGGTTTAGAGGEGGGTTTTTGTGAGGAPPLDPNCGPDSATFADVAPILERSCSNQFCHGSPTSPSAGLDLRTMVAVGSLVDQDAASCSREQALVVPFMPSSSYLMNKLKDVGLCDPDESKMPPGSSLPDAEIKTINDWICAGAPTD